MSKNPTTDAAILSQASAVAEISALAIASVEAKPMTLDDGTPVAVLPNGGLLRLVAKEPAHLQAQVEVGDIESFVAYVSKHGDHRTLILLAWREATLTAIAILDHHGPVDKTEGRAGFGLHVCVAKLKPIGAWARWLACDRKNLEQQKFAELLEDLLPTIMVPTPAELMDVVTSLEAAKAVRWKHAVRLQNGDRQLIYSETTEAKAGQEGSLTIPTHIQIALVPYRGAVVLTLRARFKYHATAEGLTLRYEIEDLDIVRDQLLEDMRNQVRAALPNHPVLLGEDQTPRVLYAANQCATPIQPQSGLLGGTNADPYLARTMRGR